MCMHPHIRVELSVNIEPAYTENAHYPSYQIAQATALNAPSLAGCTARKSYRFALEGPSELDLPTYLQDLDDIGYFRVIYSSINTS
jgi:hypothetical protein